VNGKTAPRLAEAGVNVLVAGSYVFGAENPEQRIKELKSLTIDN
jgi:ribulose-phosphate 3-epimerase